jgi:hypothetical protein
MPSSDSVVWLRERFQEMIGNEGAGEPWCLTEEEASELIDICEGHIGTAMEGVKNIGMFLRREREKRAMFYTQEETLDLLRSVCRALLSRARGKLQKRAV